MPRADAPSPDGVAAFRGALLDAGLLVATPSPGVYHRGFEFERIVAGIDACVADAATHPQWRRLVLSPVQPMSNLEHSGYVTSFPNLIGIVSSFEGGEAQVPEILTTVDEGGDWTELTAASGLALCSAACHGVYPLLVGDDAVRDGVRCEVSAWCFRHEPSDDPARLQTFRMHEYVYVGEPGAALAHRDEWLERGRALFESLGLEVGVVAANDPFFGRAGRLLAANQREKELKYELVAPISSAIPGAIGSANYHEDHFGAAYSLHTRDGEPAHSACIGFGLDRVAVALLLRHGVDVSRWPSSVQAALWPPERSRVP